MFIPRRLRGKLLIKRQLDPLNVVAQLDGRSQLQVHTLLHCWEVQQQKCLSVNLLQNIHSHQIQFLKIALLCREGKVMFCIRDHGLKTSVVCTYCS